MRANHRPTCPASRNFSLRSIGTYVIEWSRTTPFARAPRLHDASMHVHDALRTSLFVQRINVLRTKKEAVAENALQFGESEMCRIRPYGLVPLPPLRVKLPHQRRVSRERFRSCNILYAVATPQAICAAESGQPAFRAHAGSCQNEE